MRAWEQPVETVLGGGLSTLPLAPLSDVHPDLLPLVVRRMAERLEREAPPSEADELWVATYTLFGLRYPPDVGEQLMRGVRKMRESVTCQAILDEGGAEGERELILLQGERKFGPPDPRTRAALEAITDPARLASLGQRLLDASTWDELLAQPTHGSTDSDLSI